MKNWTFALTLSFGFLFISNELHRYYKASTRHTIQTSLERKIIWFLENKTFSLSNSDLVQLLSDADEKQITCLIQVGANKGDEIRRETSHAADDPTVNFLSQQSTRALLIEPVPENIYELRENTKTRTNQVVIVHAAVSVNGRTSLPFYAVKDKLVKQEFPRAPQWFLNQIGSFQKEHVVKHFAKFPEGRWGRKHDVDYYIKKIDVTQISPQESLRKLGKRFPECNGKLHVLHVDAEGLDLQIVQHYFLISRPELIVFEQKHIKRHDLESFKHLAEMKGYATWIVRNNFYALKVFR